MLYLKGFTQRIMKNFTKKNEKKAGVDFEGMVDGEENNKGFYMDEDF